MSKINSDKLIDGIAPVFAYFIQNSDTDTDDTIVQKITEALEKVKAKGPVNEKDFVDGIGKVIDFTTDLTPTTIDDALIDSAFQMSRMTWEDKLKKWLDSKFNKAA